jgi:Fe2+ or Zn2+ uptake regulation protein
MKRRDTVQRQAILDYLSGVDTHPTADEIYHEIRKNIPRLSKGTVYRNLKVLRGLGLISELDLEGEVRRFEYCKEPHYHFRCKSCGKVQDIAVPVDRDLDRKAAAATGLDISGHQLEFRGLCKECR